MFQAEIDKTKNLLRFAFSQHVTRDDTTRWRNALSGLIAELQPGFKLLSDFTAVETMDVECAPDIEFGMELCDKALVGKVVRIIPDPRQDIGFSIMSLFHYHRRIPIVTCMTMEEALAALGD
jgi:hypothetical protein